MKGRRTLPGRIFFSSLTAETNRAGDSIRHVTRGRFTRRDTEHVSIISRFYPFAEAFTRVSHAACMFASICASSRCGFPRKKVAGARKVSPSLAIDRFTRLTSARSRECPRGAGEPEAKVLQDEPDGPRDTLYTFGAIRHP